MSDELLSAGAAARRLGVAVTTLRSWHQRYGLGPSGHEHGHHRRYTGDDLARLVLMQRLVTAGVAPAEAARWARRSPRDAPVPAPSPGSALNPAARSGGGYTLALGDADPAARGLARAALRLDVLAVRDLVAAAVADRGVVGAWDEVLCPVLVALGVRAAAAAELVEVEHALSGCVSAVFASLASAPSAQPARERPVRILLACADEEQHSLPTEALAAALAERGIPSRVLGARVPPTALRAAVRRTGPVAVLLWAHSIATADPAQLNGLLSGRGRPAVVAAGGPGWDAATVPSGVVLPATLVEAVELFVAAAHS
ncbi:MerR family transcriptional regulator [Planosporangium mesophilum]|uniref:Transcriptional regulator n=1 Tax=Planosporangium mesophilum TaxID=689768 RepID=A0A8J3TDN6_9ACTN|nr:MerR family transcriptional regulator [Planosporangium mesophilum]NJC82379.1 MerR family transcriptional regulator [Planosporangium mesophilum]GII24878.1 transcriptional regulator [Planosporangium mesophilum]